MFRPSVFVSFFSLIYSWIYIYCSFFSSIFTFDSDVVKIVANIVFAGLAFCLALISRKKTSVSQSDNEINFAIASVPLAIAIIDPLANLLKSHSGNKFVIEHWLGLTAFGWAALCSLCLYAIVIIGIKLSK